ncbi:MAG: leucine--tRNA ligase [Deltaproteobacteria bacterium RBG_13_65_10]|nr:MAG: leucine--tRNA ligase [Deltaproteobacteria bacterium RBG_13_65_10]
MDERYQPRIVEKKWQAAWEARRLFATPSEASRPKFYLLEMFPYPSGRIHMGHVRVYAIGDVLARSLRMKGHRVLHPMGWDAFGLPAENAAIQNRTHPAKWTRENIAYMRGQLRRLGLTYDWSRELATCDPAYYRWEQWVFLRMIERGLAYRADAYVNWCETCQTVLANEQVEGGLCWRCESPVGQKQLSQWFLRITAYAEELLAECDRLTGWPERVLTMQRNWIGKSLGAEIDFRLEGRDGAIRVFTTRQDTVFGATFMSLAAEHPMVIALTRGTPREAQVRRFVDRVVVQDKFKRGAEDYEKEGIFTGAYCLNPVTGARMPIYVANFVLMDYGTGAVMAVPAHDQRDFDFARKYDLPVIVVVQPEGEHLDGRTMTQAYTGPGSMVNAGRFDGMTSEEFNRAIVEELERKGKGRAAVNYRLKDWGVSRQRYWGAPIPVIHCERDGTVPVPDEALPVVLPIDIAFDDQSGSPLARHAPFVETVCPRCGGAARRETDTLDTFVESSWYFLRYLSPREARVPFDRAEADTWMPVDQYVGGIEHAVLHLLYARFFTKVLRDLGLVGVDEPFKNLLTQGMVRKENPRTGKIEKMSKSKGNVVDPGELIERYGADTARLFILFAAPPEKDLEWSDTAVEGAHRFLSRVWRLVAQYRDAMSGAPESSAGMVLTQEQKVLRRRTHVTIKRVSDDLDGRFHFNTAVSSIMELVNALYAYEDDGSTAGRALLRESIEALLKLLHPFTPHITEELWEALGHEHALLETRWPQADPAAMETEETTIVVQVNGRLRDNLVVPKGTTKEEIVALALTRENVRRHMGEARPRKEIYIPEKLLNLVM